MNRLAAERKYEVTIATGFSVAAVAVVPALSVLKAPRDARVLDDKPV
jgi:hypothetical protein